MIFIFFLHRNVKILEYAIIFSIALLGVIRFKVHERGVVTGKEENGHHVCANVCSYLEIPKAH